MSEFSLLGCLLNFLPHRQKFKILRTTKSFSSFGGFVKIWLKSVAQILTIVADKDKPSENLRICASAILKTPLLRKFETDIILSGEYVAVSKLGMILTGTSVAPPGNTCSFPFTYQGQLYYQCFQTVFDAANLCNKFVCIQSGTNRLTTCTPMIASK